MYIIFSQIINAQKSYFYVLCITSKKMKKYKLPFITSLKKSWDVNGSIKDMLSHNRDDHNLVTWGI